MMDESARLLVLQQQLEKEADSKINFFGLSINETMRTCLLNGMSKRADKIKSEFSVSEKRWVERCFVIPLIRCFSGSGISSSPLLQNFKISTGLMPLLNRRGVRLDTNLLCDICSKRDTPKKRPVIFHVVIHLNGQTSMRNAVSGDWLLKSARNVVTRQNWCMCPSVLILTFDSGSESLAKRAQILWSPERLNRYCQPWNDFIQWYILPRPCTAYNTIYPFPVDVRSDNI